MGNHLVGTSSRSIGGVLVAPVIKGSSMRIRAVACMKSNGMTTGIKTIHRGSGCI